MVFGYRCRGLRRKPRRAHSYRTDHLQVAEIGFIDSKIPGEDPVGVYEGMGADEKIAQDMEPFGGPEASLRTRRRVPPESGYPG